MNKFRSRFLKYTCTCLFILCCTWLYGAPRGISLDIEHVGRKEGFKQNHVNEIFQDSKGFLWFCTAKGPVKYDGYTFTGYDGKKGADDAPGLLDVQSIAEDRDGFLWICSGAYLVKFDPARETFIYYEAPSRKGAVSSVNVVFVTLETTATPGVIWVGTLHGLARFDKNTADFTLEADLAAAGADVPGAIYVESLVEGKPGILWMGTNRGLFRCDVNQKRSTRFPHTPDPGGSKSYNLINDIHKSLDEPGILWVSSNGGLERFDTTKGAFLPYAYEAEDSVDLRRTFTGPISPCGWEKGVLWVGTLHGLVKYDTVSNRGTRFQHRPGVVGGLSDNKIWSLAVDDSGVLWVGTRDGGLNKITRRRYQIENFRAGKSDGLMGDQLIGIAESRRRSGVYWLLGKKGLNRFERGSGHFDFYPYDGGGGDDGSDKQLSALYQPPSQPGILWVGNDVGELFQFDIEARKFVFFAHVPHPDLGFKPGRVTAFHESPATPGLIWIGNEDALYSLDIAKLKFTRYPLTRPTDFQAISGAITVIGESAADPGVAWIGTRGQGLIIYDFHTGLATHYLPEEKTTNLVGGNHVYVVHQSLVDPGLLWLGTGSGLYGLFYKTGAYFKYKALRPLRQSRVKSILEDDHGNLWMGTPGGMYSFNPGDVAAKIYDTQNGFTGNFSSGAACKSRSGEMVFAGYDGLDVFVPGQIRANPYRPRVVVTGIHFFERDSKAETRLEKRIPYENMVVLSYRNRIFSLDFSVLDYNHPGKNRYAYLMEGYDKEWRNIGCRRTAAFKNLPPGSYTLRLKGANHEGVWSEGETTLRLVILTPFYRTWWFTVVALLLLAALVVAAVKFVSNLLSMKGGTNKSFEKILQKCDISERERQIVELLLQGKSNKDIEEVLFISYHTVKNHVYNIYKKLGIKSRGELLLLWKTSGSEKDDAAPAGADRWQAEKNNGHVDADF